VRETPKIIRHSSRLTLDPPVSLERSYLKIGIVFDTPRILYALRANAIAYGLHKNYPDIVIDIFAPLEAFPPLEEILVTPSPVRYIISQSVSINSDYKVIISIEDDEELDELGYNYSGYYLTTLLERENAKKLLSELGIPSPFLYLDLTERKEEVPGTLDKLRQMLPLLRDYPVLVSCNPHTHVLSSINVKRLPVLSLKEKAAIIEKAALLITSNSDFGELASSVNTPSLTVGKTPLTVDKGTSTQYIFNTEGCAERCLQDGYCRGMPRCSYSLTPKEIVDRVDKILRHQGLPQFPPPMISTKSIGGAISYVEF